MMPLDRSDQEKDRNNQSPDYFLTAAFPLQGHVGGLISALSAERSNDLQVTILAPEQQTYVENGVRVQAVEQEKGPEDQRWRLWFSGYCPLVFPEAHTCPKTQVDVVRAMHEADLGRASEHAIGSFERLIEFIQKNGPDFEAGEAFNRRFSKALLAIPRGAVMRWQSFFFEPAMNMHAEDLREKGIYQSFHLHEAIPERLVESEWGKKLLLAMSKMDRVYVHTDVFKWRLEHQLEQLAREGFVKRFPEIKVFNLGIDRALFQQGVRVTPANYTSTIPQFDSLAEAQKAFLKEVFSSAKSIPHRFLCMDRVDPVKGSITVYQGIDQFLSDRLAAGETPEEQRQKFRFFFLQNDSAYSSFDPRDMYQQYVRLAGKYFAELQMKHPGIIFAAEPFAGAHKAALPAIITGCHGITGGTTEGLNLAIMEMAKVNEREDTTIIVGNGAGFAMAAKQRGLEENAYFPEAGNPQAFARSFHEVVHNQSTAPGNLGERKFQLVTSEIDSRQSSIVLGEPGEQFPNR